MPAAESSLRITEAYRSRLFAIRGGLEGRAVALWNAADDLNDFTWTNRAAAAVEQAQNEAVALTGGYLSAFLSSEVGTRTRGPVLDRRRYSGLSRDGRPLRDALRSPMIGFRLKLAEGEPVEAALKFGLDRAKRMVSVDYDHAHRTALTDGLAADERFQGWQRAVTGTCGACAGDIAVEVSTQLPSIPLRVHPNCQCVTEPVVKDRPQTVARATGQQLFDAKSPAEQDAMLGPEAAAAVREGRVALDDLVDISKIETADDFITQKPLTDVEKRDNIPVVSSGIEKGQVYGTSDATTGRPGPNWQILSVDGDVIHATRVRKADAKTWEYDKNAGRDFPRNIIEKHWTLIGMGR